jgi:hypothetical protein
MLSLIRTSQLALLTIALFTVQGVNAEIYRSVDANGNPVFSDTPSQGGVSVELQSTNTTPATPPRPRDTPAAQEVAPAASSLHLSSPRDGEVFANGRIGISVSATTNNPLKSGQRVRFSLNGKSLQNSQTLQLRIPLLPRGEHQIRAELLDADDAVMSQDTANITVYWPQNQAR